MRSIYATIVSASISATLLVAASPVPSSAQSTSPQRSPHVKQLDPIATESTEVFQGPPETYTMRSGYMVLAPAKSVGKHSTRGNEEAVIVLAGNGEMRITGGLTLQLKGYSIAYCPPMTEHDVINTGSDTLRYIWLVSKAQP